MATERPYLVLTLRRTGGTSLMALMARESSFPRVQHEPFNAGRIWGAITEKFRADGDEAALEAALEGILAPRPNIKHCFEIMPTGLTRILARLCAARGYRIFTLTRRDEVARLRSLAVAEVTGAWGPKQAAQIYPAIRSGARRLAPIDLPRLKRRYEHDVDATRTLLDFLSAEGVDYRPLVFEDVYARDDQITQRVSALMAELGIDIAPDDPRLEVFAASEGQDTAGILPFIPNLGAFQDFLAALRTSG